MQKASLESEFFGAQSEAEDTEEMYWLRLSDDAQSKIKLGNALSAQYRFREAAEAFREAIRICPKDAMQYVRLGGAELTRFQFERAEEAYQNAVSHGLPEKSIAFQKGILHYFQSQWETATQQFEKCLPCDDELAIAVQYWHDSASLHMGRQPSLTIEKELQIHHHTAYQNGVRYLRGELSREAVMEILRAEESDLDFVILAYAVLRKEKNAELQKALLQKSSVWPSVAYLAAYKESQ